MAVSKRRVNRTRAVERRTHYKASFPKPIKDKDGSYKMLHRANPLTKEY